PLYCCHLNVFPLIFVFFFQAEDGIRYFHVTGVQTCALPISKISVQLPSHLAKRWGESRRTYCAWRHVLQHCATWCNNEAAEQEQIGRASCRERGQSRGGDGAGGRK